MTDQIRALIEALADDLAVHSVDVRLHDAEPVAGALPRLADALMVSDADDDLIATAMSDALRALLRALADEADRLQARITALEAELEKPVAGPWRGAGSYRYRIATVGTPRNGLAVVLVTETGWRALDPALGRRIAHGPETGPEAERLADEAAAPLWRLTPTPKDTP